MGLNIPRIAAERVFAKALKLARSRAPLPTEWIDRTRRVAESKSKTFTPVLGTALLAKATDRRVDAFALRESEGHKSYSARSLAKEVLVPCCVKAGIDIRSSGAEPLNNQPFLRATRISTNLEVKANAKADLQYLCECITRVDFLEDDSATKALAAFLRARSAATAARASVVIGRGVLPLQALEVAVDHYLEGDSEGGKTGQAVVAAILDLVFANVLTKRINDPSMKWPGDVGVFEKDRLVLSAEVKQRSFSETEILLLAKRLADAGAHRALIAALKQDDPLDDLALRVSGQEYGVEVFVYRQASVLLREGIRFAGRDLPVSLELFPARVLARLDEIEVSEARRLEWTALFVGLSPAR
jgi:hypothetical protein